MSIRDFKLKSNTVIPAGTLTHVTPYNRTTANVEFHGESYNVNLTDLHKWFDQFEKVDMQDLETSNYRDDGWPIALLTF